MKQRALIAAAAGVRAAAADPRRTDHRAGRHGRGADPAPAGAAARNRSAVSLLFISHNLGVVQRLCDSVAVMYASQFVELGDVRDVLERPAHPYSKGLLASRPPLRAAARGSRLPSIQGQMPSVPRPDVRHACSHRVARSLKRAALAVRNYWWLFRSVLPGPCGRGFGGGGRARTVTPPSHPLPQGGELLVSLVSPPSVVSRPSPRSLPAPDISPVAGRPTRWRTGRARRWRHRSATVSCRQCAAERHAGAEDLHQRAAWRLGACRSSAAGRACTIEPVRLPPWMACRCRSRRAKCWAWSARAAAASRRSAA